STDCPRFAIDGKSMRRREFIVAVGGAALWPLAGLGQQTDARIVGVLYLGSLESAQTTFGPAQRRLSEMGYVEGRNLVVEYRCADHEGPLAALAGDLVQRRVDAIVTYSVQATAAAKAATTSIPIIFFTGADPVESGLVTSLNRPGGNVTGVAVLNAEVLAKRLEILCELVPVAKFIGLLYRPRKTASYDRALEDLAAAADALHVKLVHVTVQRPDDLEEAFAKLAVQS